MPTMNLSATLTPAVRLPRPFLAIRPGGEVQEEVTKPTQFKQGIVSVVEKRTPKTGKTFFELRYIDPPTGKEVRRRVSGLDLDEIREMAENLTRKAYLGKGYLAGQPQAPGLGEALAEVIRLSRARKTVKRKYEQAASLFVAWIGEHYPAVRTWDGLRPAMVLAYLRELERGELAYDTIRNRLVPIRAAWKHAAENWPELVKPLPRIKLEAPPRREIECLEADEVAALLGWLKANRPALWPMACLQGLAGLRMMEAAALRRQDVDLKAGTVTVTDTGQHKPKTRDSFRTVPVCGEVLAALQAAMDGQKIRPLTGELFTTAKGTFWTVGSLSHRWAEVLPAAARALYSPAPGAQPTEAQNRSKSRLLTIPPRKLRAAFATMVSRAGAPDRLLKAYLGHSAGDMLGGHYRRVDLDELRAVSGLMDDAVAPLCGGKVRKESGNIEPSKIVSA